MIVKHNDLEKTQEMPVITDKTMLLPPELRQPNKIYGERVIGQKGQRTAAPRRWLRQVAMYVGGFFVAAIIGYTAFNSLTDSRELAANDRPPKQTALGGQSDGQGGLSLAEIERKTKNYAIAINDKAVELQAKQAELTDGLNQVQEGVAAVKNQADAVLAENQGMLAAVKKFFLEQKARLQEFFSRDEAKK